MTFRPNRQRYRKPVARQSAPEPSRAEYHVPGGTIVYTSRQWPAWIAIRFDGERLGARRCYAEAAALLAEFADADPSVVAKGAAE